MNMFSKWAPLMHMYKIGFLPQSPPFHGIPSSDVSVMNWFTHGSVPFIRHSHGGENGRAKADVIYWVDYEREGVNKSLA